MSIVFVKENFFPLEIYNFIVKEILSVEYSPPPKWSGEQYQGNYWNTHTLPKGCELQTKMKELVAEHFYFKDDFSYIDSWYTMVGASDQPRPHIDESWGATHQLLIYMHGEESRNNGTGFYHVTDDDLLELSYHIGFKKNRAVFYTSDVYHAPLQWAGCGSFRYSIANFLKKSS